ncbi:MAG: PAS domain S-box protein [Acidobacteriota bacterium]|nr:PAS domain S-box protein [Acidobacteriota bacterium]
MHKSRPDTKKTKPSRAKRKNKAANRAAQSLQDASERWQSILFANEMATWTWDVANDRVIADKNLARLFGVSPKDAAGGPIRKYIQAIHPEDRAGVKAAIEGALHSPNHKYETDYRIGKRRVSSWVRARGRVETDKNGKATYFSGVIIDVTERKLAEQKTEDLRQRLEQQSRLFDTTLSSITDFAYIFDRDGRFIYVNQALLDLWGLKLEEAVGKNFYELQYPHELARRLHEQIQQVILTKSGLTDETAYTSPTGVAGYYEYIFRPVFDRDGNVESVAGSTRDISERKRVEEQLRQSQERFRVLAESLENQVLARTSELEQRNSDVLMQSEQLRNLSVRLMETQDHERRHIARELHDSAGQIVAALLMNLGRIRRELSVSNPKLAQLAKETQTWAEDLNQEMRTTSYLLHPPLLDETGLRAALDWYVQGLKERANLDVTLNIHEDFERPTRDMELTVFRVVQECLTNIHRHSGSKTAQIRIAREDTNVVIEVQDAGRGISAENLSKIQARGTGVGLRGVRERVRQFGGVVRMESQEGSGTTVFVSLPLSGSD